jgi:hypothetical protein
MRTNKKAILHVTDGESRIYFILKCREALPLTDVISEFSRDPLGQGDHRAHHAELLRQVSYN